MEKEEWRDIEGYPNYRVSNLGRVKSLGNNRSRKEKILKPIPTSNGYLRVQLWKNKKGKILLLHRLVAMAFLDNSDNFPQCNHKDENKKNNCVENLEWCTVKYNNNYGTRNERAGNKTAEANSKPLLQINKFTNEVIREWKSTREVERKLGFNHSAISKCCLGKQKVHKGFKWQYKT